MGEFLLADFFHHYDNLYHETYSGAFVKWVRLNSSSGESLMRNFRGETTIDATEIQKVVRDCYKQLHTKKTE